MRIAAICVVTFPFAATIRTVSVTSAVLKQDVLVTGNVHESWNAVLCGAAGSVLFMQDLSHLVMALLCADFEVLQGSYNHSCDIWSCGVIMCGTQDADTPGFWASCCRLWHCPKSKQLKDVPKANKNNIKSTSFRDSSILSRYCHDTPRIL